ncbi:hypothetical protein NUW54_g13076 [Trametes sanguinea]|uniref:Uncharacterized protein n=1 Tax=Trametes sanguinea TaxID=158606 RepID=A0ACC1MQS1_9APHY|nr:hypothetical protein NUW54_g13076 [Trametes sanguinea]
MFRADLVCHWEDSDTVAQEVYANIRCRATHDHDHTPAVERIVFRRYPAIMALARHQYLPCVNSAQACPELRPADRASGGVGTPPQAQDHFRVPPPICDDELGTGDRSCKYLLGQSSGDGDGCGLVRPVPHRYLDARILHAIHSLPCWSIAIKGCGLFCPPGARRPSIVWSVADLSASSYFALGTTCSWSHSQEGRSIRNAGSHRYDIKYVVELASARDERYSVRSMDRLGPSASKYRSARCPRLEAGFQPGGRWMARHSIRTPGGRMVDITRRMLGATSGSRLSISSKLTSVNAGSHTNGCVQYGGPPLTGPDLYSRDTRGIRIAGLHPRSLWAAALTLIGTRAATHARDPADVHSAPGGN